MENKLNHEVIGRYSVQFSDQILSDFFKEKDSITGNEILELTRIKQVNRFVIYKLLQKWRKETKNFQSPYFDYSSKAVKEALQKFMDNVSRHIKVDRDTLKPLLEEAVFETILLVLSPYDYYCNVISRTDQSRIKIKRLKELNKYVSINESLLNAYIRELGQSGTKAMFVDDALRVLNEVFEKTEHSPEDIEQYVELFNRTKLLQIDVIYGNVEAGEDALQSEGNNEIRTVNDQHASDSPPSLVDVYRDKPIHSIKSHLSLNQKFMFINQLFDGSTSDFNKVIEFLDNCSSQVEAMDFINNNYLKKSNWKKDAPEVKAFIDVVAKKYA